MEVSPTGIEYFKRAVGITGSLQMPVESLTAAAAAQTLAPTGISFLSYPTSGVEADFELPNPPAQGAIKLIAVNKGTSSEELEIHTLTTAQTFWGTTFNTAQIDSSTVFPGGSNMLMLIGVTTGSTGQWAVCSLGSTTQWAFLASTGSTADDTN